ncbi:MAG: PH domain-containing protein [Parcubacteria group bacterium]|nr:PH domain-containing protein [Parcubacteria group bacterium]
MIDIPSDEKILLISRRHYFTIYAKLAVLVVLIFMPIFIWLIIKSLPLETGGIFLKFFFLSSSLYALFLIGTAFFIIFDYLLDYLVLTNERILEVEQKGYFNQETHEFRLSTIQNINIEINGFIATWLDFGDLKIYTAAEKEPFIFNSIPHPNEVKKIINYWWEEALKTKH